MSCKYEKCNIETIDGNDLCQFHAPIDQKTISDDDFRSHISLMIRRGNLDFQGYVFSISVEIPHNVNPKRANFQNAVFYKLVQINGTKFNTSVSFADAEFKAGLELTSVNFGGKTDFTRSRFTGSHLTDKVGPASIYCELVTFHSGVDFTESEFQHQAYFLQTIFHGQEANFFKCKFQEGADFSRSKFNGQEVSFSHSEFGGPSTNFSGCHFQATSILFSKVNMHSDETTFALTQFEKTLSLNFEKAEFLGNLVDFGGMRFNGDQISFVDSNFSCKQVLFHNIEMSAKSFLLDRCSIRGSLSFISSIIEASMFSFSNFQIDGPQMDFTSAIVKAKYITFFEAQLCCDLLDFSHCKFECMLIVFHGTTFIGKSVDFSLTYFGGDVLFRKNRIRTSFLFIATQFAENSRFYFTDSLFEYDSQNINVIFFYKVRFNPSKAYFERISPGVAFESKETIELPILGLRYCNLKEVFFAESDMSIFSFYRCALFEEAFLTTPYWHSKKEVIIDFIQFLKFERRYVIHEDFVVSDRIPITESISPEFTSERDFEFVYPNQFSEVAELYLRYKSAADKARDYNLASWFYFNEFEMKRRQLVSDIRSTKKWYVRIVKRVFGLSWVYSLYKVLAGYGEKPMWSFFWLTIFTTLFSIIHLFNGISVKYHGESFKDINYKLDLAWPPPFEISLTDIFFSLAFTLSRIIPTNYFPGKPMDLSPLTSTPWDYLFSILNSFVLVLMVVFVAIGLKRHFRRF